MFEIPFNVILINPVLDIFIFISFTYFFIFKLYKKMIENESEKIQWMDLKLTFIFIMFAYLNYSGMNLHLFNLELDWLSWVLILQIFIEGFFIFFYWDDVKVWWGKVKKINKKKNKENLKKQIKELEFIKKFMEDDIEQLKSQGDKKTVVQLENEIKKVSKSIGEMAKELNRIENDKN